ncbi:hypothetical protein AaE_015974 [Aphanomyces astaci]|uniref:SWIM-type domain-containing protein n=1 Tax=Aphanomyces astaci TaxID=112090 RepID=A0A6A4YYC8_APHAT|nr:hypothetical protein AaE_015974 [Aphanomyces astaci]
MKSKCPSIAAMSEHPAFGFNFPRNLDMSVHAHNFCLLTEPSTNVGSHSIVSTLSAALHSDNEQSAMLVMPIVASRACVVSDPLEQAAVSPYEQVSLPSRGEVDTTPNDQAAAVNGGRVDLRPYEWANDFQLHERAAVASDGLVDFLPIVQTADSHPYEQAGTASGGSVRPYERAADFHLYELAGLASDGRDAFLPFVQAVDYHPYEQAGDGRDDTCPFEPASDERDDAYPFEQAANAAVPGRGRAVFGAYEWNLQPSRGRAVSGPYEWNLVSTFASFVEARDAAPSASVYTTVTTPCTMCSTCSTSRNDTGYDPAGHQKTTRYLHCKCRSASRGSPECSKLFRIVECLSGGHSTVWTCGEYAACLVKPLNKMTKKIRNAFDALFKLGCTPSQSRHKLKEDIPALEMPSLKSAQNRHRYFRQKVLLEHNSPSVMCDLLVQHRFEDDVAPTEYFAFGYDVVDGRPSVGFGGSSGVFKVGVTTKALLYQMNRSVDTFLFHWDGYLQNQQIGLPLAFFLIGKESTSEYAWAIRSLIDIYLAVVGRPLKIKFVMGDAAQAPAQSLLVAQPSSSSGLAEHPGQGQQAALAIVAVRIELGVEHILMCFYHCLACVHKRLNGLTLTAKSLAFKYIYDMYYAPKSLAFKYIYDMHYARNQDELSRSWQAARGEWLSCDELIAKDFTWYFDAQWMQGTFTKWQVFHTPSGFASTNNPSESFNKHFKGIYTEHNTHGMCATFTLLGSVAEQFSTFQMKPWSLLPVPSAKLVTRTQQLKTMGLLEVVQSPYVLQRGESFVRSIVPQRALSMAFAFESRIMQSRTSEVPPNGISEADLDLAKAFYNNANTNNIRHERIGLGGRQLECGWMVCTRPGSLFCHCNYFFKNAFCCHLLFALDIANSDHYGRTKLPLAFERPVSKSRGGGNRFGGRGNSSRSRNEVGPALSLQ